MVGEELEHVLVTSRAQWREWLKLHHDSCPRIWLVIYKKATGLPSPTYDDIVEEALCFGWIDSKTRKIDAEKTGLLLTPRRPNSVWSARNKRRLDKLIPTGLMAPAGLTAVEVARQNGSFFLLDAVERLEVPDDLSIALDADPQAEANFNAFGPSSRKMILGWVISAKRPETRARRISEVVACAAVGKRATFPQDR